MGTSQMLDGRGTGPSTPLALPNGYFVPCPIALTTSPPALSSFLSERVHFESGPLWRGLKGLTRRGVAWAVLAHIGQRHSS